MALPMLRTMLVRRSLAALAAGAVWAAAHGLILTGLRLAALDGTIVSILKLLTLIVALPGGITAVVASFVRRGKQAATARTIAFVWMAAIAPLCVWSALRTDFTARAALELLRMLAVFGLPALAVAYIAQSAASRISRDA